MIDVGDPAPEIRLESLGGGTLSLSEVRSGASVVLLVFLRHLG